MNEIKIKDLSLAAFIKMKGCEFLSFENLHYIFKSNKTESEWKIIFLKSESKKFDSEVRDLRWFLKK